jgi:hypothetical protein
MSIVGLDALVEAIQHKVAWRYAYSDGGKDSLDLALWRSTGVFLVGVLKGKLSMRRNSHEGFQLLQL